MTKKTKKLLIIGAGGHGKVVADCAEQLGCYQQIAFLDPRFEQGLKHEHWPIIDTSDNFALYQDDNIDFFVAIGENSSRKKMLKKLIDGKFNVATLVHPNAVVSDYVQLGRGTLVCANATINAFSKIGVGVIINTNASVDHDCSVEDFVHIAPNNGVAGGVVIKSLSFIGIGSSIIQGITIGENTTVGAGSVVINHLPDHVIVVGCPAKVVKNK